MNNIKKFIVLFLGVLTKKQKKHFAIYVFLLFIASISSIFGISAVIPFIALLAEPEKAESVKILKGIDFFTLLYLASFGIVLAFWIKNSIGGFVIYFQTKFLNSIAVGIKNRLFKQYIYMPYQNHLNRSTPHLIKIINNEIEHLSVGILNPIGHVLVDSFAIFFTLLLLFYLNFLFSLIIVGVLTIFIYLFVLFIRNKLKYYGVLRSEALKEITKSTIDALQGIKETKLYHKENYFTNSFNAKAHSLKEAGIFIQFYQQIPKFFIEIIAITTVIVTLMIFKKLGTSTSELILLVSVFGIAAAQLLPALNRIMASLTLMRYSIPALVSINQELHSNQISSVYDNQEFSKIKPPVFNNRIELSNIDFSYSDGTKALNDISCTIEKGKRTAFIGPSGAGKSTLVDLLMGFYQEQNGNITLDGRKFINKEKLAFQKLFAYIPQQIILFDATIRENIAFGQDANSIDNEKVWKCLDMAQMKEFVENLKGNLEANIGEGGIRLSGGQRQRLGIARALYQDPEILVMDEATSALDSETESKIVNMINKLTGLTIVTIAHRLSTIKGYDKVYKLSNGVIES